MKIFLHTANPDAVRFVLTGSGLKTFLQDWERARGPLGKIIATSVPEIGR